MQYLLPIDVGAEAHIPINKEENDNVLVDQLGDQVELSFSDPKECKCVHCHEDKLCGGLWK